jgi:hypothetical protein
MKYFSILIHKHFKKFNKQKFNIINLVKRRIIFPIVDHYLAYNIDLFDVQMMKLDQDISNES